MKASGGSCPINNSFTPGTKVLMADGSTKPIEDVKVGDKVKATDPKTGETRIETVTAEITACAHPGWCRSGEASADHRIDPGQRPALVLPPVHRAARLEP
nr:MULTISPECIES: Hint domain-containing homing endonuclease [unclassified Streptomyces]